MSGPEHYRNFCENLRIAAHSSGPSKYQGDSGNPCLPLGELLSFLSWLDGHPTWNHLALPVALQGLCGLRVQEALRLKWGNVDSQDQTVTVEGEVKNAFSVRCIPIPDMVIQILDKARSDRQEDSQDSTITSGYCNYRHYSHAVRKAMHKWNPSLRIKPKDLRNWLPTAAYDGGWHSIYVERYMGHSPQSITEKHYHANQGKRLIPLYWGEGGGECGERDPEAVG